MKLVNTDNLRMFYAFLKTKFTAPKATNAYNDEDGKSIKGYYRLKGTESHSSDTDWNMFTSEGVHQIDGCTMTDAFHAPSGEDANGILIVEADAEENRLLQTYYPKGYQISPFWTRMRNGEEWTTWNPMASKKMSDDFTKDYAPAKDGTNATGKWPVSISGGADALAIRQISDINSQDGTFVFDYKSGISQNQLPAGSDSLKWSGIQFSAADKTDRVQFIFNGSSVYMRSNDTGDDTQWGAWKQIVDDNGFSLQARNSDKATSDSNGFVIKDHYRLIGEETHTGDLDWDTFTSPGCHKIQDCTMDADHNAPVGEYASGILLAEDLVSDGRDGEQRLLQSYYPHHPAISPLWVRMRNQNGWTDWMPMASEKYVQDYAPTKTGVGASGTWGIDVTGNAASATNLQTARKINGVDFDGTADITINAVDATPRIASSEKGVANGVATLDANGMIPSAQLPSYVDDVKEYDNISSFPATGETDKIYVAQNTGNIYRWSGSAYVRINNAVSSAEQATKLATARTIGGVAFDGTANINLPGVNIAGNQNTSGNAATATTATNANYVANDYANMRFHWNGQGGQPTWLWGGADGKNMYVYNPSNFSVNHANSAGNADTVDGWHRDNIRAWGNITSKPATATRWPSWSEVTSKPSSVLRVKSWNANTGTLTIESV